MELEEGVSMPSFDIPRLLGILMRLLTLTGQLSSSSPASACCSSVIKTDTAVDIGLDEKPFQHACL